MSKRTARILEIMTTEERIEVARLAEMLEVSQVTVRKDLDELEGRGLIRREHGFAVLGSLDDINNRLAFHYDIKRRIARLAAASVYDGETVMIESGSCCALLAEELASTKSVTIITNSAFIAGYIRKYPGVKIVLLGGEYQAESQVSVGPIVRKCAESFFVDKLFIGTDGFTPKTGFTGNDYARAETTRDLARQADKVIVLTEASKFSQQGVVSLLGAEQVAMVYTDEGIPADREEYLREKGVAVHKVAGA